MESNMSGFTGTAKLARHVPPLIQRLKHTAVAGRNQISTERSGGEAKSEPFEAFTVGDRQSSYQTIFTANRISLAVVVSSGRDIRVVRRHRNGKVSTIEDIEELSPGTALLRGAKRN